MRRQKFQRHSAHLEEEEEEEEGGFLPDSDECLAIAIVANPDGHSTQPLWPLIPPPPSPPPPAPRHL